MHDVRSDVMKNRLYLTVKGHPDAKEVEQVISKIRSEVQKLSNGFDLVNDITEFVPASAEAAEKIKELQKLIVQSGVNRVVRITTSIVADMQIDRTKKESHSNYQVLKAKSLKEAEELLDAA